MALPPSNEEFSLTMDGAALSESPDGDRTTVLTQIQAPNNGLPLGTRMGEFEITGLVGEGGFGIVYLAHDHSLQRKVALKEYMPASLASRAPDSSVTVRSERHRETFDIGRRSFVNEAHLLAQYDHPALVKVYRFWEANGTAYMVMPYYEGVTLRDALRKFDAPPDEAWIRKIIGPVTEALDVIHRDHCYHRDIAPDNIMLLPGERPVLLDFGAARRVISDMTQALTVILKPGYAPIEQYANLPGLKQGPWTDIYALAAVIYFMIAGKTPPPAVGRMVEDDYEPIAKIAAGKYSAEFLQGVDRCLRVKPEDRPKSMTVMRAFLGLLPPGTNPANASVAEKFGDKQKPGRIKLLAGAITAVVLALLAAVIYFSTATTSTKPLQPSATTQFKPGLTEMTLADAFEAAQNNANPNFGITVDGIRNTLAANKDPLTFRLQSMRDGYLYVILWDEASNTLAQVFPNERDTANLVQANQAIQFPRPGLLVRGSEASQWFVMAIVSASPREYASVGFNKAGGYAMIQGAQVETRLAEGTGPSLLTGKPRCPETDACSDAYGAAMLRIKVSDEAAPAASAPQTSGTLSALQKAFEKLSGK